MKTIRSPRELTKQINKIKRKGRTVGFVPTMGALHEGHLSLIRCACRETDILVVSIFVNPTQFGRGEDLSRYPRRVSKDEKLCKQEGVDLLFLPSDKSLYAEDYETYVNLTDLTKSLCGAKRPGHFRGVATVVAKLFNIVKPDVAYFGKKDYQQTLVIKKMVRDLNFDTKIRLCPIVRECDGLAMSSRNFYLKPAERNRALSLSRALQYARKLVKRGERNASDIKRKVRSVLRPNVNRIDYVEVIDTKDLKPVTRIRGKSLIALACFIGKTRLIDNCEINV